MYISLCQLKDTEDISVEISARFQPSITKYSRLSSIINLYSKVVVVSSISTTWWFLAVHPCRGNSHLSSLNMAMLYIAMLDNTCQCYASQHSLLWFYWCLLSAASEIFLTPSKSHQLAVTDKIRCLVGPKLFTICTKRYFETSAR